MNRGYLQQNTLDGRDWILGGVSGFNGEVLCADGQWDNYLPEYETQYRNGFDVYACVTFATLNAIETLLKQRGVVVNLSDRYIAAKSGTKCGVGNYMATVAQTLRDCGAPLETDYPWGGNTCEAYYSEMPSELDEKAKELLKQYEFQYLWAYDTTKTEPEARKYAIQFSPITVAVNASDSHVYQEDGIIKPSEPQRSNHCVMCYGYEDGKYWKIYDHYDNKYKKYAWDYKFGADMMFVIKNKEEIKPMLPEQLQKGTHFIQNTQGDGSFALLIDGKMYVDEVPKLIATYITRTEGSGLAKELWDALEKYNLKNQLI